ncbi:MAG: hypothetical protein M3R15_17310 [Acidobacteriota bacterium]|nr:hypothetical protein [Acidobacteriota bacterium]
MEHPDTEEKRKNALHDDHRLVSAHDIYSAGSKTHMVALKVLFEERSDQAIIAIIFESLFDRAHKDGTGDFHACRLRR